MDSKKKLYKAKKELLEDFFKNRKLKIKNEKSYPFVPSQEPCNEYKIASYYGEIKNSFDLIEYLKPCFVYIASDNIKEKMTDGVAVGDDSKHFYFEMGLFLKNEHCPEFMYEPVGLNWNNRFKKKLKVYQPLYGNKIKKYIRNECSKKKNTFSFNVKPIRFEFVFKIRRSDDYLTILDLRQVTGYFEQMDLANNNKKINNAEKFFKEDECVICLTNLSNILFCNCVHQCVCEECCKTGESLEKCPICKTENTIIIIIE